MKKPWILLISRNSKMRPSDHYIQGSTTRTLMLSGSTTVEKLAVDKALEAFCVVKRLLTLPS
jgi:hypothetical protein